MGAVHKCPHPECRDTIGFAVFACRRHWYSLPTAIRREISNAWAAVCDGRTGGLARHDRARASAQQWWQDHP